jgi:hypothetical protein
LNERAPFFSLECWIDSRNEAQYGRRNLIVAMFFTKEDAERYAQELKVEVERRVVEGDPIIQLIINECSLLSMKQPWRIARFNTSIENGYQTCRRCIEQFYVEDE